MAIGALASTHSLRAAAGSTQRFWSIVRSILFLAVALASKSSTSVLVILYLYSATFFILLYRRGGVARFLGASLAVISVAVAMAMALFPDAFLEIIGKDVTLTGRTELWDLVQAEIAERPIAGWGYFAFWGANPAADAISAQLGWGVPHAHNGLLEMLLEVGVIGTMLILVIFLRNVWFSGRCLRTPSKDLGTSSLLCCGAVVITGMTELVLVDFSGGWTMLFFVLGLMCERTVGAARRQQYFRSRRAFLERPRRLAPVHGKFREPS